MIQRKTKKEKAIKTNLLDKLAQGRIIIRNYPPTKIIMWFGKRTKKYKNKLSDIRLKRKERLGYLNSPETKEKLKISMKGKNIGEKNGNWKGGKTSENQKIRYSIENRLWRESVFARDNWTCQDCGDNKGGNLEAHHIKSFAEYPELRFAIDNGKTLCKKCHKKIKK